MRMLGELALAILLGVLSLPAAWAGTSAPMFQSFDLTANGSITGQAQFASLNTVFHVPTAGTIDLQLSFFGPGAPGPSIFANVGNDPDLCDGVGTANCQLMMPVTFGPNLGIVPGVTLTAVGTLINGTQVTTQSSFVAVAAPEPATLALFGAGLLGAAFMRRRARS